MHCAPALLCAVAACYDATTARPTRTPLTLNVSSNPSALRDSDAHAITFERFALGAIDGQFDWKSLGGVGAPPPANPADTHCAVYDHEVADVATVLGPRAHAEGFGRRSLRISNAVTSGCYADATFSARAMSLVRAGPHR